MYRNFNNLFLIIEKSERNTNEINFARIHAKALTERAYSALGGFWGEKGNSPS
jgi:hypothetical protein